MMGTRTRDYAGLPAMATGYLIYRLHSTTIDYQHLRASQIVYDDCQ